MRPRRRWGGPPLARQNLKQNPGQLGLAIAAISFAVALLFMQLGILGAVLQGATLIYDELDFDIVLISQKSLEVSFSQPFSQQRLYQVAGLKGVESIASFYTSFANWQNPETLKPRSIFIMAFDPRKPVFKSPEINDQLNILSQQDTALFNRLSNRKFGPQTPGTVTEMRNRYIRIGGNYTMNNSFRFDGSVILSAQNFLRFFPTRAPDEISLGLVTLEKNSNLGSALKRIKHILPPSISVYTRQQIGWRDQVHWLISTSTGIIIGFGVLTALMIGAVIVYQVLNADVLERLPEYGMLKATGYSNQRIARVVLTQASILATSGFSIGLIFGLVLYEIMRSTTSLPIAMPFTRLFLVLILTFSMCNGAALFSLQRVIKLDPSDVF